ncbi:Mut7-C RNAse domain-containing protein [Candidatus Micrarchaeota archaeon]|nr:Mut7-C RNAse domain-containing protein [Candidatus Micrarchaeota archaeon]
MVVIRFVCDVMLGRLTRYLRMAGYETDYPKDAEDDALIKKAAKTGAVLLTRDHRLFQKAKDHAKAFLVKSNDVHEQLDTVARAFRLQELAVKTRFCTACGEELQKVPKKSVAHRLLPRILERQTLFWECTHCGKLYWPGTHVKKINETLKRLSDQEKTGEKK